MLPGDTPCTTPLPTVATDAFELLQVPPDTVSLNVVFAPVHVNVAPDIAPANGDGITVIVWFDTPVQPAELVPVTV